MANAVAANAAASVSAPFSGCKTRESCRVGSQASMLKGTGT